MEKPLTQINNASRSSVKIISTLKWALIIFGLSVGFGPTTTRADIWINATESGGNTVVTITGCDFTTSGLTPSTSAMLSTFIVPSAGAVCYTGSTDTLTPFDVGFNIPTFSFGTGGFDSAASNLLPSNPFIAIDSAFNKLSVSSANPTGPDFFGSATYSGTIAAKGIDTTPQTIALSNGQMIRLFQVVPPDSQPDGKIGPSFTNLKGDDIYNLSTVGQTVVQTTLTRSPLNFSIEIDNDGKATDTMKFNATKGTTWFDAKYLYFNGSNWVNATGRVITGNLQRTVSSGDRTRFRASYRPTVRSVGKSRTKQFFFRTISLNSGLDRIRAVARKRL